MTVWRHKRTAWPAGRSITRAVLALSVVGTLLVGCTWALNDSAGTTELEVTIPPHEGSVGALQVTEDTELFVHIIEADRFEALYADAEVLFPGGDGLPPMKRLRGEQLGISRAAYVNAREDADVLQSSRFAWFFGQGAQDGVSLTFRDLSPDTEYVLYAIQGERRNGDGFLSEYWWVAQEDDGRPISLDARQNRTVVLESETAPFDSPYSGFFNEYGVLPYDPPLPPRDEVDVDGEFTVYEGIGEALELSYEAVIPNGIVGDTWSEVEYNEAYVFHGTDDGSEDFADEGISLISAYFYNSDQGAEAPLLIVGFVEEAGVTEPQARTYQWPEEPFDPNQPPDPGSIVFVVFIDPNDDARSYELSYFGDLDSDIPPAENVDVTDATFTATPSAGGVFSLGITGQGVVVDEEPFLQEEADIVVSEFSFEFGQDITEDFFF